MRKYLMRIGKGAIVLAIGAVTVLAITNIPIINTIAMYVLLVALVLFLSYIIGCAIEAAGL